ncbi:glycosyltransferase [Allokutzneria sp. NRRL B-24872]|uniref:glycosyltransferase n=1 Tax=Allokutzneria sp. NRRL B-24872 TaxID=1137961 RepID=UPI000A3A765D|nr:glycosyltransferase [Allokutzneria sp. NRRL B-24872]
MRILIVAIGTRGDVAPYVGLGAMLNEAGYSVAVAAHEPFSSMVRSAGLEFRAIPGDVHAVNADVLVSDRPSLKQKRDLLEGYWREIAWGTLDAAKQGTDLLLLNFTGWLPGVQVAEALGLPSIGVNVYPVHRTGDFAPISLNTTRSFGRLGNRVAGVLTNWTVAQAMVLKKANAELRSTLGLPPATVTQVVRELEARNWPIYHGFSPTLLPRPSDWRPGLDVCGFWWPAPSAWEPSRELLDFLASGPPPVFVGFGSTAHGSTAASADLVLSALRSAGVRGVVQADWSDLGSVGDDVITVGDVPFDWLFPQVSAVVCHAGVGTAAYALRAGVPVVGVPLINDQSLWATRLAALGVSPAPLPHKRLTSSALASAITAVLTEPSYRDSAERVAPLVRSEDGFAPVLNAVNHILSAN